MYAICAAICACDLCLRFMYAIWGCDSCCDLWLRFVLRFMHAILACDFSSPTLSACFHSEPHQKNVQKLSQKTLQKKHQTQHLNPEHAPPRASHQLCCVGDKTDVYGTLCHTALATAATRAAILALIVCKSDHTACNSDRNSAAILIAVPLQF